MFKTALSLGFAALSWSATAKADVAADIRAAEAVWGGAFKTGDHSHLHSLLAPEFRLMRAENGKVLMTTRAQWFAKLDSYKFEAFDAKVVDVAVAGNTAVATVEGHWKVGIPNLGVREESFILSDTWVRRGGKWQVVYRHSTPTVAR